MIASPYPSSLSGFTAYYAHKRALKNAALYVKMHPEENATCLSCKDTKKMSISVSTLGKEGSSISEIDCIHCLNGPPSKLKQIYDTLVWCKCRHGRASGFIKADDGSRVFGNTTYLCSKCGFVKQFG